MLPKEVGIVAVPRIPGTAGYWSFPRKPASCLSSLVHILTTVLSEAFSSL